VELPGGAQVKTGANGEYAFARAGPGLVNVHVKDARYNAVEEVVSVPSAGEGVLDLVLIPKAERRPSTVSGRIRSIAGKPVAARLKVPEAKLEVVANKDGLFEFKLPGGKYRLVIEADGFVAQSKTIDVADGDQALFYVDLSPEH
jgi:hypothetical protein